VRQLFLDHFFRPCFRRSDVRSVPQERQSGHRPDQITTACTEHSGCESIAARHLPRRGFTPPAAQAACRLVYANQHQRRASRCSRHLPPVAWGLRKSRRHLMPAHCKAFRCIPSHKWFCFKCPAAPGNAQLHRLFPPHAPPARLPWSHSRCTALCIVAPLPWLPARNPRC